jgi:hypothetical protein
VLLLLLHAVVQLLLGALVKGMLWLLDLVHWQVLVLHQWHFCWGTHGADLGEVLGLLLLLQL